MQAIPEVLEKAYHYFHNEQFQQAEQLCLNVLDEDSESYQILYLLSQIALKTGRTALAKEYAEKALLLKQDDFDLWNNLGLIYQTQGEFDQAIVQYQEALQRNATLPETWIHLGAAFRQKGNVEQAIDAFQQAARLKPEDTNLYQAIAVLLQRQGKFEEAVAYYHQALSFHPNSVEMHCNIGLVLCNLGRFDEAAPHFQKALQLKPDLVEAHLSLGMLYFSQGKYEESLAYAQRALVHKPDYSNAYLNAGNVLKELKRFSEARAYYDRALQLSPRNAEVYFQMGHVFQLLGRMDKAMSAYQQALELQPALAEAHNNMGNIYKRRGQMAQALESYQKALSVQPNYASAYCNLGLLHQEQFNLADAVSCFEKAVTMNPRLLEAHENLGDALLNQNRLEEAIAAYNRALTVKPNDGVRIKIATALPRIYQSTEELFSWRQKYVDNIHQLQQETLKVENPVSEIGVITFFLAYHGLNDKAIQQEVATLFSRLDVWQKFPPVQFPVRSNKKPKIGIISRYFVHTHTISKVFTGILDQLSRELFDIVVFCIGGPGKLPIQEPYTHINLPLNDLNYAYQAIANQHLDLLLYTDIGMDPLTYFLGFCRLAPVQCVTWGHPTTTGMDTIDYYISSRLFETDDSENHYTETLVCLDSIPTYFYPPTFEGPAFSREHFGLSPADHLYLCPQSLFKFHPDFDETLGNILRNDPQGVLVLTNAAYKEWGPLLMQRFERSIPDVVKRIRMFEGMEHTEFLSLISHANVMLDTTHFGGGRTTYEAFSLGTPIVTLPSAFMRGRMTYGCYQKMGITDCIATTPEEYIDIALRLGTDSDAQETVKSKIMDAKQALYEDIGVVRELEAFFLKVIEASWSKHPGDLSSVGS